MTSGIRLFVVLFLVVLGLFPYTSCSRYSLGGTKPAVLKDVHSMSVAIFENQTYYPRAEVLLTSAVTESVASDGSYELKASGAADATLHGKIRSISLSQIRAQRYDSYSSLQSEMVVECYYEVVRNSDGKVLTKGSLTSRTNYFNQGNEQSDRWNAYSFAARNLASMIVSQISHSY